MDLHAREAGLFLWWIEYGSEFSSDLILKRAESENRSDPFWFGSVFQLGSETTPSRISTIELEVGVEEESHARLSASSD